MSTVVELIFHAIYFILFFVSSHGSGVLRTLIEWMVVFIRDKLSVMEDGINNCHLNYCIQ
jgi:hypothetical protein